MNLHSKVILIVFLWGLCNSCTVQEKKTEGLRIDIDSFQNQACQFDVHIERYIVLDTTEVLVNSSDKYIFKNQNIYISDRKGSIHIFSDSGKYVNSISRQGRGPGEYLIVSDFDVDTQGNVYVLCANSKKIIKYHEPDYLSSDVMEMDKQVTEICLQENNVWVGNIFTADDKLPGLGLFEDGVVTPTVEAREDFDNLSGEYIKLKNKSFYFSDKNLLFNQRLSREVYQLKEGKKELLFTVQSRLPVDTEEKDASDFKGFRSVYRSGDLILGHLWQSGNTYPLLLISDLSTGKSSLCMPNDIGFPVFGGTFCMKDDHFIGLMDASLLAKGSAPETRKILKKIGTISPESNPVIVEFTLFPKK